MPAVTTVPSALLPTAALPTAALPTAADALAAPRGCTHLQLRQLVRQVGLVYDAELAVVGLKTTQYSLLSGVQRLGPVRPVDLARAMKMEPSTLTRNLKPLIAAGWVLLAPGADGRSRAISITPAGEALRAQARGCWRVAQDRLNHLLGAPRVAQLHALIQDALLLLAADPSADSSSCPDTDDDR